MAVDQKNVSAGFVTPFCFEHANSSTIVEVGCRCPKGWWSHVNMRQVLKYPWQPSEQERQPAPSH